MTGNANGTTFCKPVFSLGLERFLRLAKGLLLHQPPSKYTNIPQELATALPSRKQCKVGLDSLPVPRKAGPQIPPSLPTQHTLLLLCQG